jgi:tRNA U34 2-thiouridine synthase MnmA/TrmU
VLLLLLLLPHQQPNPDALCNRHIKFKRFREHALGTLQADFLATGHYAQLSHTCPSDPAPAQLRAASDASKDQSYFLATVPHSALKRVLCPLGGLLKAEVRQRAAAAGLITAAKKDSTGLCFVGKRKSFSAFLSQYLQPTPGAFWCICV